MSPASPAKSLTLAAALLMLSPVASLAGELPLSGDGSFTDNPELLRPGFSDCTNCKPTGTPLEWDAPFFDVDWSLGLRGGYITGTSGSRFTASLVPLVSLSHKGLRSSFTLGAGAELVQTTTDPFRIATANLALTGAYRLDPYTVINASGGLSLSQDAPNPPAIEAAPQILSGTTEASITRDMGRFSVGLRGSLNRTVYGPTTTTGGVIVDNEWQNNVVPEVGLRLSVPITPVLSAFAEGSANYRFFDGISPDLGVSLNGPTYMGRTGLAYEFNDFLSGEASVGLALRRFDAGLPDVSAILYDASLVFTPDETTTLTASLGTSLDTPGTTAGALAKVKYTAAADLRYKVNPWVTLRSSAGWYHTDVAGTGGTETGYNAGIGADYLLNERTTVSIDYVFEHAEAPPATPTDTHKLLVGLTVAK